MIAFRDTTSPITGFPLAHMTVAGTQHRLARLSGHRVAYLEIHRMPTRRTFDVWADTVLPEGGWTRRHLGRFRTIENAKRWVLKNVTEE